MTQYYNVKQNIPQINPVQETRKVTVKTISK